MGSLVASCAIHVLESARTAVSCIIVTCSDARAPDICSFTLGEEEDRHERHGRVQTDLG